MKRILLIIIPILLSIGSSFAQQDAMFTHYMFNTQEINPGYAGSREALTVTGLHRSQWLGFKDAPVTQTFTLNSPIFSYKTGLGISFLNDVAGPLKNTGFSLDFAYRIKLRKKAYFAFGLKAGLSMLSAPLTNLKIIDTDDVVFQSDIQSKMLPNFGFGLYFNKPKYYLGLSIPKLLENNFVDNTSTSVNEFSNEQKHFYFIAGTVFDISSNIKLKPTTFIKATASAPIQGDITASFIFYEKVMIGGMFRTGDALGVLAGLNLTSQFTLGYSFDWSYTNKTFTYNAGSHEIMLRYDFVFENRKMIRSPRYL